MRFSDLDKTLKIRLIIMVSGSLESLHHCSKYVRSLNPMTFFLLKVTKTVCSADKCPNGLRQDSANSQEKKLIFDSPKTNIFVAHNLKFVFQLLMLTANFRKL